MLQGGRGGLKFVRYVPNGTNLGLIEISFSTFWLDEEVPDLSHLEPIILISGPSLTSLLCCVLTVYSCVTTHYTVFCFYLSWRWPTLLPLFSLSYSLSLPLWLSATTRSPSHKLRAALLFDTSFSTGLPPLTIFSFYFYTLYVVVPLLTTKCYTLINIE